MQFLGDKGTIWKATEAVAAQGRPSEGWALPLKRLLPRPESHGPACLAPHSPEPQTTVGGLVLRCGDRGAQGQEPGPHPWLSGDS